MKKMEKMFFETTQKTREGEISNESQVSCITKLQPTKKPKETEGHYKHPQPELGPVGTKWMATN